MLLAIDIGNTHCVLGIFRKAKLQGTLRLSSSVERTEDELWLHVEHFAQQTNAAPGGIDGIVIASVVPHLTDVFRRMAEKYLKVRPVLISTALDLGIAILYDDPARVGADRICNAVAAFKKFGGPAIVIDFGTATTYDVISRKGEYIGGVIAPGLSTAASELHRRTAQLPRVDLRFPENVVGKDTVTSMQSGIMYGCLDAVEGMVRRIKRVAGKHAIVIATGGYAGLVAGASGEIKYIEPALVLEGARLIYERISKKESK